MSMLAERKRKAKWIIHSSKKPLWDTDAEGIKFGKELMEKMGWTAGKGLGVNEQGITEPLKVSHKVDTKGVGYKGNEESWTKQQDEFDYLLSQLSNSLTSNNSEQLSKAEIKSLEEKSKKSRARVHYQKFTRGKDFSRYNEKDLACILGTSKLTKQNNNTEKEVERETDKTEKNNENNYGFKTINSGSLEDYFKKKWMNKKKSKNINDLENKDQCSNVAIEQEGFSGMNPQNYSNSDLENQDQNKIAQPVEKSTSHLAKSESVEEKSLETYMYKKKKRKNHKEFNEKEKKSKKNKAECEPDRECPKTENANINTNNLLTLNSSLESENEFCKIGSENLINYQTDKDNFRKEKKHKKQKKKEAERDSVDAERIDNSTASPPVHYDNNNSEEKHLNNFKNHKHSLKENVDIIDKEGKNKEKKKSKKYKICDPKTKENNSDNETLQSELNKKNRVKNKKNVELKESCDSNEVNLEFNSEKVRKHKKSKKKKADREVENGEEADKDLNENTSEMNTLNLTSEATKAVTGKHEELKFSEIEPLDRMNNAEFRSQIFERKYDDKEILGKNEKEFNNENNNFTGLLSPSNNVMYSVHIHKKKLNCNKIIKLMYGASIDKFIGSNLSGLPGYGTLSRMKNVKV